MALPVPNKQLLILAGVIIVSLVFYIWLNWEQDISVAGQARAPGMQAVESVPGGQQTPAYNRLQVLADGSRASRAEATGDSAVPTPPTLDPLDTGQPVSQSTPTPTPAQPAPAAPAQPPPPAAPRINPLIGQMAADMQTQAQRLIEHRDRLFSPAPTRMTTYEDTRGLREQEEAKHRAEQLANASRVVGPRDRSGLLQPGDILYAVMQTAINSDEPGPVRAKIVGERFKGAILLGSLNELAPVVGSRPERVVVSFNYLTTTDRVTHSIDGYAIDLDTARTALATGVDHHYLSRWGALIAASFLEGYGGAVRNSNRITTVGPLGNVITVPKDDIDDEEIAREALGTVGERLADAVGENFRRPNTIMVDAGTGIGVLIVASTDSELENAASESRDPAPNASRVTRRRNRSSLFPDGAPVSPMYNTNTAPTRE
ncbi:MAG: TrbI/VirB10 family protein [Candidatus Competibacteraceae bacterium]|jgi:type IV secretory pathway VirB10-like protein|nr:TrbI/VirB10 family protein [Candidatus Competibacteraceae bacterium]